MIHNFLCECGNPLSVLVPNANDKVGEQCDVCLRVYDVWFDGRYARMPLPPSARVKCPTPRAIVFFEQFNKIINTK